MNNNEKLLKEMEKEYPRLAETYNAVMSGTYAIEDIRSSYESDKEFKAEVDKAREKYLYFFQDMGLL